MPKRTTKSVPQETRSPEPVKRSIKTPQALIHIRHRISLLQYKIWMLCLRDLREQLDANISLDENGLRYIPMSRISEGLGYVPNKAELFNDLQALKNETVVFNLLEKDGKQAKSGAGFISQWSVSSNRVGYSFPPFIELMIKNLREQGEIFHLLNWSIFNSFNGKYDAIIYKLCKDYVGVGQTPMMSIEQYRDYMGLRANEYEDFRRLSTRVIKEPCNAINESDISDINVEPNYERAGRKVVGVRFFVQKKNRDPLTIDAEVSHQAFSDAKAPIDQALQTEYLSKYNEEEIRACIQRANEYGAGLLANGKSVNWGGLYRTALENAWHHEYLAAKKRQTEIDDRSQRDLFAEVHATAVDQEQRIKTQNEVDETLAQYEAMPKEWREQIDAAYSDALIGNVLKETFRKNGHRSAIHRNAFASLVREHLVGKDAAAVA